MPKHTFFHSSHPEPIVLGPIGECIYAPEHPRKELTREHIMPFGLGGGYILLDASCKGCANITRQFETHIQHTQLKNYRVARNYPSRKGHPDRRPVLIMRGGIVSEELAPRECIPEGFVLPQYLEMPGIFEHRPRSSEIKQEPSIFWGDVEPSRRAMKSLNADQVGFKTEFRRDYFARMVAKIAHGALIAHYGVGQFTPWLPEIILNEESENANYLIGRGPPLMDIPCDKDRYFGTAAISVEGFRSKSRGVNLVTAHVRLFAHIKGTPTYWVVGGSTPDEPKMIIRPEFERRILTVPSGPK